LGRNSASAGAFSISSWQFSVSFLKPSLLRRWQTQEKRRLKQQTLSTWKMIETSTLRWKILKKTPQRTPKIHQVLPSTTKRHKQRASPQARYHIKIEKIRRYGNFCPRWTTMPLLYAPCTLFPFEQDRQTTLPYPAHAPPIFDIISCPLLDPRCRNGTLPNPLRPPTSFSARSNWCNNQHDAPASCPPPRPRNPEIYRRHCRRRIPILANTIVKFCCSK
jgi:hypothetical protein